MKLVRKIKGIFPQGLFLWISFSLGVIPTLGLANHCINLIHRSPHIDDTVVLPFVNVEAPAITFSRGTTGIPYDKPIFGPGYASDGSLYPNLFLNPKTAWTPFDNLRFGINHEVASLRNDYDLGLFANLNETYYISFWADPMRRYAYEDELDLNVPSLYFTPAEREALPREAPSAMYGAQFGVARGFDEKGNFQAYVWKDGNFHLLTLSRDELHTAGKSKFAKSFLNENFIIPNMEKQSLDSVLQDAYLSHQFNESNQYIVDTKFPTELYKIMGFDFNGDLRVMGSDNTYTFLKIERILTDFRRSSEARRRFGGKFFNQWNQRWPSSASDTDPFSLAYKAFQKLHDRLIPGKKTDFQPLIWMDYSGNIPQERRVFPQYIFYDGTMMATVEIKKDGKTTYRQNLFFEENKVKWMRLQTQSETQIGASTAKDWKKPHRAQASRNIFQNGINMYCAEFNVPQDVQISALKRAYDRLLAERRLVTRPDNLTPDEIKKWNDEFLKITSHFQFLLSSLYPVH